MGNTRFYIEKVSFKTQKDAKPDCIPMLLRRKLSNLDKLAISTINSVFDDNIEEFIFSSQYGEFERLFTIIEQYTKNNEVSPIAFSASVHNYIGGILSLVKHSTIPYYAISAGENSLSYGLIKSIISKKRVLYCYADNFQKEQSVSLIISPDFTKDTTCVEFQKKKSTCQNSEFESFYKFLNGELPTFNTDLGEFNVIHN